MDKLKMHSLDGVARNIERIGQREPLYRGRQSGSAEAPAGDLSGQDQDDLHRPALQHGQRLCL